MVIRCLMFLFAVALSAVTFAQPAFTVSLLNNTDATIELGKPLWLELHSNTHSPELRSIELNALRGSFHVDSTADVTTDDGQQHWQLRVYAYHTGNITIPSLYYDTATSSPLRITVTDPVEPKSGLPMPITTAYSYRTEDIVWARQQITLRHSIRTNSPYSQFRMQPVTTSNMDMQSFVLPTRQLDSQTYLHELGWSIHPAKHGSARYEIPALNYISDGVATHTFHHPPLQLNVTPLPLYIPATMPVGRLRIHNPDSWLFSLTNSLSIWHFSVSADGVKATSIPDLSTALASTTGLRSYPATLSQTEHFTASGLETSIDYRLPFKTTSQGIRSFEPVTVYYFDPVSGRIQTVTLNPPYVITIRTWVAVILLFITLLLVYHLLKPVVKSLFIANSRYQLYRRTLQQLQRVTSATELRQCLRQFAAANGLSENVPISQCLRTYTRAPTHEIEEIMTKLNEYFYQGRTTTELTDLKSHLHTLCRNYYRVRN